MILNKNKEKITKEFLKGHIDEIQVIIPNVADKSLTQIDKDYKLDEIINGVIDIKRHEDSMGICIFIYSLLAAKLKRLFSITESTFALTSVDLLKNLT